MDLSKTHRTFPAWNTQTATGVDLVCQALFQIQKTDCETHESTCTSHTIRTKKTAGPRTGPSIEREAEVDLGASPDGVHEVDPCHFEKCSDAWGVTTRNDLRSRVVLVACH